MTADAPKPQEVPEPDPNFIGGTPLAWAIVEKDLQKYFGTTARFGDNRKAEKFGANQGYISQVLLADLDWTEDDEKLPKRLILKITETEKLRVLCEQIFKKDFNAMKDGIVKIHDNEVNVYTLMRDEWNCADDMRMPKFYFGRHYGFDGIDAGYLAIEFIDNCILRHMYHTVQVESAEEVLGVIAKLGARALKDQAVVKRFEHDFLMDMFKDIFSPEKTREGFPVLTKMFPELEQHVEFIDSKLEAFVGVERYQAVLEELEDILRFLNGALPGEDKVKNRKRLIQHYHDTLVKECNGEVEVPFTVEKLNEAYERILPTFTFPALPAFVGMFDMVVAGVPDDEKEGAKATLRTKMWAQIQEALDMLHKWY
ncbi:unnamed protein product, partial [Mesorhabditis spiculigera]